MMRRAILTISFICWAYFVKAQPPRDTSYNLAGTLVKTQKSNPGTRMPVLASRPKTLRATLVYKNAGRPLTVDHYRPKKKSLRNGMALILVHGGGWASGDKTMMADMATALAQRGYDAYSLEYRLSPEAKFPAAVIDLMDAIRYIREPNRRKGKGYKKVFIAGHSAGGELVSFAGANAHNPTYAGSPAQGSATAGVDGVINLDGTLAFIHPESSEGDDSKSPSAATRWIGVSKTENRALWIEAAPLSHFGPQTPPFLFVNSSIPRFHAAQNDGKKILDRYGIYYDTLDLINSPHNFPFFEPWFTPVIDKMDAFMRRKKTDNL